MKFFQRDTMNWNEFTHFRKWPTTGAVETTDYIFPMRRNYKFPYPYPFTEDCKKEYIYITNSCYAISYHRHASLFEVYSNSIKIEMKIVQLAGAEEYTDCTSAKGVRPCPNMCPGHDTKQSDSEVPVML